MKIRDEFIPPNGDEFRPPDPTMEVSFEEETGIPEQQTFHIAVPLSKDYKAGESIVFTIEAIGLTKTGWFKLSFADDKDAPKTESGGEL